MKLTTRSEYALLAMVQLARAENGAYLRASDISCARRIPHKYLEQILLALKQARLLTSRKGARGGYRLARPAGSISLAEIVRRLDGALAPTESVSRYFYEPTPIEGERRLLNVFREIRDQVAAKLEGTSLADVSAREEP
ncbi:MAG TPA: Rrf2 family transcriptional regulator [Elusimicrobiota bacterium]|nr:Rrf2 family transcriptional regulator [Elusimicrobiota bacterium]